MGLHLADQLLQLLLGQPRRGDDHCLDTGFLHNSFRIPHASQHRISACHRRFLRIIIQEPQHIVPIPQILLIKPESLFRRLPGTDKDYRLIQEMPAFQATPIHIPDSIPQHKGTDCKGRREHHAVHDVLVGKIQKQQGHRQPVAGAIEDIPYLVQYGTHVIDI